MIIKSNCFFDYSEVITHFTDQSLPPIYNMVRYISNDRVYTALNLKREYNQIHLREREREQTLYKIQTKGLTYQFKYMPFGINIGVGGFQRIIDEIMEIKKLEDVFIYVNNIKVYVMNKTERT